MPTTVDTRFDVREATTGGRLDEGKLELLNAANVDRREAEEI
jgi:hypothetical protein